MPEDEDKVPFTSHLEELRKRLINSFIAAAIGFAVCYGFKQTLFIILATPLVKAMGADGTFVYTGLPEAFFTYLKSALIGGLIVAAPAILYQFWMFVAPGLYKSERRLLMPIIFLSTLFFVGGALFGYFVVFPFGFDFLLSFSNEIVKPLPSMKEYLSFASKLLLAFGIVFELPLMITAMARLGIVSVDFLKKNRKYAIVIFFVGAAIITPPDPLTQVFMALPLMILYEISILGARIFGKKKVEEDTETAEASE